LKTGTVKSRSRLWASRRRWTKREKWDPDFAKHKAIKAINAPLIPAFSIQLGGSTSIEVTRPRIDKAYGVRKLRETLGIAIADMTFVGR
jgi:phosphomannomutase